MNRSISPERSNHSSSISTDRVACESCNNIDKCDSCSLHYIVKDETSKCILYCGDDINEAVYIVTKNRCDY